MAEQGDAKAQNVLGGAYTIGDGVPKDYQEAIRWYRLAADQRNASAQYYLGRIYNLGRGVPKDYKEAIRWYRLAADQGHAAAQWNLGLMYVCQWRWRAKGFRPGLYVVQPGSFTTNR